MHNMALEQPRYPLSLNNKSIEGLVFEKNEEENRLIPMLHFPSGDAFELSLNTEGTIFMECFLGLTVPYESRMPQVKAHLASQIEAFNAQMLSDPQTGKLHSYTYRQDPLSPTVFIITSPTSMELMIRYSPENDRNSHIIDAQFVIPSIG